MEFGSESAVGRLSRLDWFVGDEDIVVAPHRVLAPTPLHVHEFFEIVYVAKGSLEHRFGSTSHRVAAGDLFVVNPHIPHGYELQGGAPALLWNVLFVEEALSHVSGELELGALLRQAVGWRRNPADPLLLHLDTDSRRWVERTIREMWQECQSKGYAYRSVLRGQLTALLGRLGRLYHAFGEPAAVDERWERVVECMRYIADHYDKPLSAAEVARRAGWSLDHLNRLFRRVSGDSVRQYLARVRAVKAARALLVEGCTVEEVARRVGYSDARAFRRAFKRILGVPPAEYRESREPGSGA